MLNSEAIIRRAEQLLAAKNVTQKLSEQAKAVVAAICEEIDAALLLSNQALTKQVNAVKETPGGRMRRPSIEEVKIHGITIGLSEAECEKFFDFYESKGWRVGTQPMKLWTAAMANWKRRFDQPQQNGAATVIMGREYERIIDRLKTIRSQYSDHQAWDEKDKAEYTKHIDRRNQLRKTLGITV